MKALSIKNPYANLILEKYKPIEIRSQNIEYRGDILICASLKKVLWYDCFNPKNVLTGNIPQLYNNCGFAIGIATIVDCRPMIKQDEQAAFCQFKEGSFAWVLENPRRVNPFPVKGQLGLFNVDYIETKN